MNKALYVARRGVTVADLVKAGSGLVKGLSKRLMVDLSEVDSNNWCKLAAYLLKPQTTRVLSGEAMRSPRPGSKQNQRRFTEDEELKIVTDYESGGTVHSLADKYSCHRNTISRVLKSRGIELANQPTPRALVDEMIRLYESGLSMEATAKRTHVSAKTVFDYLLKNNIETRSPH